MWFLMELGDNFVLPCPVGGGAVMTDGSGVLEGYDLSFMLVTPVDDRIDLLAEVVYVGKVVMKAMWLPHQLFSGENTLYRDLTEQQ